MKLFGENFSNLAKKTTSTKLLAIVLAFALLVTNVTMMTGGITAFAEDTVVSGGDVTGSDVTGSDVTGSDVTGSDVTGSDVTGSDVPVTYYTVKFLDVYGNTLSTQQVASGEGAVAPEAPYIEGYVFAGWNGRFDCVEENLTLTAQYEAVLMTAEVTEDTMTVMAYNPGDTWGGVYIYAWTDTVEHAGAWPGTAMTVVGDGWYSYDVPVGCTVIFNGGGEQTANLTMDATNNKALAVAGANNVSPDSAAIEALVEYAPTTYINYYPAEGSTGYIAGSFNEWTFEQMAEGSDGFLTCIVAESGYVAAGSKYEFKISSDGTWNNVTVEGANDGNATVTMGETVYYAYDGNGAAETKKAILERMIPAFTVTAYDENNLGTLYAYAWTADNSNPFGTWPGTAMTAGTDGTWTIEVPAGTILEGIIINNNNGTQTADIKNCSADNSFIYVSTTTNAAHATLQDAKDAAAGTLTYDYSLTVNFIPADDSTFTAYYAKGGFGSNWAGTTASQVEMTKVDDYWTYNVSYTSGDTFTNAFFNVLSSATEWNSAVGNNVEVALEGSTEKVVWIKEGSTTTYASREAAEADTPKEYKLVINIIPAADSTASGYYYHGGFGSSWDGKPQNPYATMTSATSEHGTYYTYTQTYTSTNAYTEANFNILSDPYNWNSVMGDNINVAVEADVEKAIWLNEGNGTVYASEEEARGLVIPEYKVYAYNAAGADALYAYAWNDDGDVFAAWPGTAMTASAETGDGWYEITVPEETELTGIIINDGNGTQTGDITVSWDGNRYIYFAAGNAAAQESAAAAIATNENLQPKVIVHYSRTDGDPSAWYLYGGWGSSWTPGTGFLSSTGTDSFGSVYTVTGAKGQTFTEFNFLMTNSTDWSGSKTADKEIVLNDQLFAEVWLTDDGNVLTECPDGFASTMLTIHYGRTAHDYDGWKIRVSANADGSDYVEQALSNEDVFGSYASAVVDGENTVLYYTITNGTDVEGSAWTEVAISGNNEEIWVTEGVDGYELTQPEIANDATSTKVVIHYQRPDNAYAGWAVWSWHDNGGSQDNEFYYEDEWGRVAVIEYDEVLDSVGIVLHQRAIVDDLKSLWYAKDGGDRIITVRNGFAEVWITASLDSESTQCPAGSTAYDPAVGYDDAEGWQRYIYITQFKRTGGEVMIHYVRENGDYTDWTVWIWGNNLNVGSAYNFLDPETDKAVYDEYAEYDSLDERICRIPLVEYPTDKLGMIIRYKDWEDKDIEADRFIKIEDIGDNEIRHIYIYQGVEELYTAPVAESDVVFNTAAADLL